MSTSTWSACTASSAARRARRGLPATGAAARLARVYDLVYAPQDRLVERLVATRLRRLEAGPAARLAYHDRATLMVVANYGLSTQLAVLGLCLALGQPEAYLWFALACGLSLVPLELRRVALARAARPA